MHRITLLAALAALGLTACSKPESSPAPVSSVSPVAPPAGAPVASSASAVSATTASSAGSSEAAAATSTSATGAGSAGASGSTPPSSAAASTSTAAAKSAKTFACGDPGQPKCPLQAWMKANIQPAMSSGDPAKVAALLRKIATMGPKSGYPAWAKLATDGAAAVDTDKTVDAAKPSCKACHDQYKSKYKSEDRDRPI